MSLSGNSLGYDRTPYSASSIDANKVVARQVQTQFNDEGFTGAYTTKSETTDLTLSAAFFNLGRLSYTLTAGRSLTFDTAANLQATLNMKVGEVRLLDIIHTGVFAVTFVAGGTTLAQPLASYTPGAGGTSVQQVQLICTNAVTPTFTAVIRNWG